MTDPSPPHRPPPRPFGRAKPRPLAGAGPSQPRRRVRVRLTAAVGAAAAAGGVTALGFALAIWLAYLRDVPPLPAQEALFAANRAPAIRFLDRAGQVIAARGPRYGERVRLADLPEHVPLAFLAAEDRRFYQHGPVELRAIVRAAMANWRAGEVVQGGSTLAQQLAKGLFLTPEQTLKRKLQEAVLAARLEGRLGKDGVLELYLNRIYFGANTYGIDGAARAYFGKPAASLTLGEAALLAALPKAPSRLAPTHNMAAALDRSRWVLGEMRRDGWITPAQEAAALAAPPRLSPEARQDVADFGYALDYATAEAVRLAGPDAPDLQVRLSLDPALQRQAAQLVRRMLEEDGRAAGADQAALVALGPDGGVRAMVGGTDYEETPFNRAVQARRQPGSAFKPFIYAAALEKGVRPTDVRVDGPVRIGAWTPRNYGGGYAGPVTVETALARSINTVAVKLAREAGPEAVGALARRFGFTGLPPRPDLSAALGAYEVSPLEMAGGFQVFQAGGGRIAPWIVEEIRTMDGRAVHVRPPTAPAPAYDRARAAQMVSMMKKVVTSGTGVRAAFGRPAAGKTGTSQNWRDAWFVGFTPDYVAAVWVGADDDRPMDRVTGGDLPAEIWRRFMIAAHKDLPIRDFDWIAPPAEAAAAAPDARNGFYGVLASEFGRLAAQAEAEEPAESLGEGPETPPS
ncbi:MAG: transglycosylase domain-containing protein [Phenylobacterium sp.]|uniref:multimodular transpeptidase-transglycosylase PbpC n=1 Tax=Phenylobacterium sp. TaxID=1871053 RepID=UPI00391D8315